MLLEQLLCSNRSWFSLRFLKLWDLRFLAREGACRGQVWQLWVLPAAVPSKRMRGRNPCPVWFCSFHSGAFSLLISVIYVSFGTRGLYRPAAGWRGRCVSPSTFRALILLLAVSPSKQGCHWDHLLRANWCWV